MLLIDGQQRMTTLTTGLNNFFASMYRELGTCVDPEEHATAMLLTRGASRGQAHLLRHAQQAHRTNALPLG